MDLESWVKDKLLEYLQSSTQRLVIAFSGGIDSTVLLHICAQIQSQLPGQLHTIHINHGLSPHAMQWQQHCALQAKDLGISFEAFEVDVQANKKGLEAAAREARYRKLSEMTFETDTILLAQHSDDQVETFLLQLLRGAGPDGLQSMPEVRKNPSGRRFIRPLLGASRQAIENYAEQHQLSWVEDESNAQLAFDRNYLRHEILPLLQRRFPATNTNILRSIAHQQEQVDLLKSVLDDYLKDCLDSNGDLLTIEVLKRHKEVWQKHIVKHWIKQRGYRQPSTAVIQQILQQCLHCADDARPIIAWDTIECRSFAGFLYLLPKLADMPSFAVDLDKTQALNLPANLGYLSCVDTEMAGVGYAKEVLMFPLQVRFGGYSVRFTPYKEVHSKPLKQWFKQWRIPPWERERTPLIFSGATLIQVGHIPSNLATISENGAENVSIVWHNGEL